MKITREDILKRKLIKSVFKKITDKQLLEIDNICRFYDNKTINNRIKNLFDFIENGVENRWAARLRIITSKLKNDGFSEYALKVKFGDNWEIIKIKRYDKVNMSLNSFIKRYGEEIGKEKWNLKRERNKSYGLKYSIERYGEEIGKEKWKDTLNRKINTMKERKKEIPYRNGRTLIEYQNRYGTEDGYNKWIERNRKQKYRFSKKFYIDKFGVENGCLLWNDYKREMNKVSLSSFIKRYGKIDGEIKFQEYVLKLNTNINYKGYSKISQELFWCVYNKLDNELKKVCKFAKMGGEAYFYVNQYWANVIFVDFKCNKKIIEFDGKYWHSFVEQMDIDKKRDEFLMSKNYEVLRIKETEYITNKKNIINKCLNFLNE